MVMVCAPARPIWRPNRPAMIAPNNGAKAIRRRTFWEITALNLESRDSGLGTWRLMGFAALYPSYELGTRDLGEARATCPQRTQRSQKEFLTRFSLRPWRPLRTALAFSRARIPDRKSTRLNSSH